MHVAIAVPVLRPRKCCVGDSWEEILGLLRECGHEPVLVDGMEGALPDGGGVHAPPVVATNDVSERTGTRFAGIERIARAGNRSVAHARRARR